jgi:hypothetical protein
MLAKILDETNIFKNVGTFLKNVGRILQKKCCPTFQKYVGRSLEKNVGRSLEKNVGRSLQKNVD